MSIKREEIKAIFPEATDEQLKSAMDLNWNDVDKSKKEIDSLKAELKEAKEATKKINTEFEALKASNAGAEEYKTKYEALVAENEAKAKQAEADRILAEKTADIEKRFNECVGDKEWLHDDVKAGYLKRFGDALENEQYKGKGDTEIFHDLTKNDERAFKGVQVVKLAGGRYQGTGAKYSSADEIMKIPDRETRHREMLANPQFFPELNNK